MSQERLSFRDVERMKTEGDLNGLRQALTDGDVEIRRATVQALGQLKAREAVAALIGMLHDEDFLVQKAAIEALGQIGDARAVEPLMAALTDESDWVRKNAAAALGKIGDARAVEPLIAAVKDEDELVPVYAARALVSIYRRGGMDEDTKKEMLALRGKIAALHEDRFAGGVGCTYHCDHKVEGIGIEFLV